MSNAPLTSNPVEFPTIKSQGEVYRELLREAMAALDAIANKEGTERWDLAQRIATELRK